ncbi:MAG: Ig-like domain-containing protein [Spirosomataceae bacterium]
MTKSKQSSALLGDYTLTQEEVIFRPLIPFTHGLSYEILVDNQPIAQIEIPKSPKIPVLLGIYPSQDTLPENLLKFYLVFSQSMVEGQSLKYIALVNIQGDTLRHTFLDLQPELWNKQRTILTLWIDPGRIKRDLQPNKLLGTPLTHGNQYQLVISNQWPDEMGATLTKNYTKKFVVAMPDLNRPKVDNWQIKTPQKNSKKPLVISLNESLDYILLQNTIEVINNEGNQVEGTISIQEKEKKVYFTPTHPWIRGAYILQIESRLEDLAGNNLNRLFDTDISNRQVEPTDKKVVELKWQIK